MSDDGEKILSGIKQLREFFVQCSLLLRTVDDQMKSEGWDVEGNKAIAYTSTSLREPKQWFPDYLYRYYRHTKKNNLLLFVSILFDDDIDGEYRTSLVQPLITAGYLDYGSERTANDEDQHKWTAAMYGYEGDLSTAGSISSREIKEEDQNQDYECESFGCFGFPLVEVHNPDDILGKVVRRLIELPSLQAAKSDTPTTS